MNILDRIKKSFRGEAPQEAVPQMNAVHRDLWLETFRDIVRYMDLEDCPTSAAAVKRIGVARDAADEVLRQYEDRWGL